MDTQDSGLQEEISRELIDSAFSGIKDVEFYTAPSLDREESLRIVTIPEGELPPLWKAVHLRMALNAITGGKMAEGKDRVGRIMRACHLGLWHRESRFCGSCGAANQDGPGLEPSRQCPSCGRLEFPRISPAVIIIVTNDRGEAVLAHNKNFLPGV